MINKNHILLLLPIFLYLACDDIYYNESYTGADLENKTILLAPSPIKNVFIANREDIFEDFQDYDSSLAPEHIASYHFYRIFVKKIKDAFGPNKKLCSLDSIQGLVAAADKYDKKSIEIDGELAQFYYPKKGIIESLDISPDYVFGISDMYIERNLNKGQSPLPRYAGSQRQGIYSGHGAAFKTAFNPPAPMPPPHDMTMQTYNYQGPHLKTDIYFVLFDYRRNQVVLAGKREIKTDIPGFFTGILTRRVWEKHFRDICDAIEESVEEFLY